MPVNAGVGVLINEGRIYKKIDVPTLILHGDDDQIVPIVASAPLSAKIIKRATLKVYPGAPHGLMATHKDRFNADLLAFIQSQAG